MSNETATHRLVAFLLRLAPRPIRNAVVGAILLLIVIAAATTVIDLAAGDNPTTQRLETRLRVVLMILACAVVVACVGVYIRHVCRPNSDPDDNGGNRAI